MPCLGLVVALEDDLLAVPTVAGESFAHAGDHEVEAADVSVDVEIRVRKAAARDRAEAQEATGRAARLAPQRCGRRGLARSRAGRSSLIGTAERGQVMEVGLARGERFELLLIVDFGLVAGAVDEPDFFALLRSCRRRTRFREEPLGKAAHGSDAGSGCDKDGVGDGLLRHEMPVGTVDPDGPPTGRSGRSAR